MREFLTSGQVGNIEINAQKKIREDIQNRWDSLGFTEGLEGNIKENIATLYENEAKHLIYEATKLVYLHVALVLWSKNWDKQLLAKILN